MSSLFTANDWIWFIASGSLTTLKYSVISVGLGMILGMIIALMHFANNPLSKAFAQIYISVIRGTPLLVQLSFFYFAMPRILGFPISVFEAGVSAFSINSGAYLSVHIRSGIDGVEKGQLEAAKTLGIPYYDMMKDVILPQAFRRIIPSLVNEIINMVKESSIIAVLGETDIMRRAQIVSAEKYTYLAPLLVAGLSYYIIVTILSFVAKKIEDKLYANDN